MCLVYTTVQKCNKLCVPRSKRKKTILRINITKKHCWVECPNLGHPSLTSSFTRYKLQVSQQLFMDCQFWNCFSFPMVIQYSRSMSTVPTKCINLKLQGRDRVLKLGHATLLGACLPPAVMNQLMQQRWMGWPARLADQRPGYTRYQLDYSPETTKLIRGILRGGGQDRTLFSRTEFLASCLKNWS